MSAHFPLSNCDQSSYLGLHVGQIRPGPEKYRKHGSGASRKEANWQEGREEIRSFEADYSTAEESGQDSRQKAKHQASWQIRKLERQLVKTACMGAGRLAGNTSSQALGKTAGQTEGKTAVKAAEKRENQAMRKTVD